MEGERNGGWVLIHMGVSLRDAENDLLLAVRAAQLWIYYTPLTCSLSKREFHGTWFATQCSLIGLGLERDGLICDCGRGLVCSAVSGPLSLGSWAVQWMICPGEEGVQLSRLASDCKETPKQPNYVQRWKHIPQFRTNSHGGEISFSMSHFTFGSSLRKVKVL